MSSSSSLPLDLSGGKSVTGGSDQEVHWEVVARTNGLTQAQIIAGRLQAEGIPAHTWQEGAGRATGLIVGPLGTGHVVVPQEYAQRALEILEEAGDEDDEQGDE